MCCDYEVEIWRLSFLKIKFSIDSNHNFINPEIT